MSTQTSSRNDDLFARAQRHIPGFHVADIEASLAASTRRIGLITLVSLLMLGALSFVP